MKRSSVFQLAAKDLFQNFSRSILLLITATILSVVILTLINFAYYFYRTSKDFVMDIIKTQGVEATIEVSYVVYRINDIENYYLKDSDLDDFIEKTQEMGILYEYEFDSIGFGFYSEEEVTLRPYLGGKEMYDGNPPLVDGAYWQTDDIGMNHIWISNALANTHGLGVGDRISLNINKAANREFIIKGVVESEESYIDYHFLDISSLTVFDRVNEYQNLSVAKEIKKISKETDTIIIGGLTYIVYTEHLYTTLVIAGIIAFLTLLCILLSIGSVLNTMKISIINSNRFIGIMKALGMRNKDIYFYILSQTGLIVVIASFISALISWLIANFTLAEQIQIIYDIFGGYEGLKLRTGFNFLLPLLNIVILIVSITLGALKMLFRHFKRPPVVILREAE
ncbi:MAG: ABC transporter permease [Bacillota bacterium]|jgi:ABC-type antimicrobial peptide transport system permease subunit|nr:ABC transporter permease [Bacillota bacterium]HHU43120.1 ABC transporter permease [Clostridiales bacterium]